MEDEHLTAQEAAPEALPDVSGKLSADPDELSVPADVPPAVTFLGEVGSVAIQREVSTPRRAGMIWTAAKRAGFVTACTGMLYWVLLSPPVAMNTFYNNVLFQPTKGATQTREINGLPVERVTFKALNGKDLSGWYIKNPKATKTVLFSHGNGGNMDSFVPIIDGAIAAGASVFAYDYQGYGASQGHPTLDGVVDDAQAAYDYLVNDQHIQQKDIVFYGVSLGTGVTMQLLKRRPAAAVILMSPYKNIIQVAREHLLWLNLYPDFVFPAQHLDTQHTLEDAHPPVLIIHGDQDRTVLVHHTQEMEKTGKQPLEVLYVPNAGHNDLMNVAYGTIVERLKKYLQ